MNYLGFVIQPSGTPNAGGGDGLLASGTNGASDTSSSALVSIKSEEEAMLERYGLSWASIDSSRGQIAADNMTNILRTLEDDGIALAVRVPLASALLKWQSACAEELREEVFDRNFFKMLEMIRLNLVEPDDYQNTNQEFGNQKPTYYLALILQRETQQSLRFRDRIQNDVIGLVQYVLARQIALGDAVIGEGIETPPSIRSDTLKCLMRCLPIKVDDSEELRVIVAIHMEISNAAIGSPSLRAEALQRVNNISIETEDDSLFEDHIDGLLDAIQQGHNEVFGMIKKCKNFFNETSEALDNKLDSLMDSVGFPDMSDMIEKIAELDPRRLVKCVPSMVKELETSLIKYKVLILGVLLNVALVYVTPLIPYVETLGMACSFTPSLFVPLFKLLTVIGSSSNDAAIKCLVVIAKIAKSDLVKDPAHQSALLEAVNVIKDSCQYCNIFKPDTIECFREYGAANAIVFKNITTWNAGKSARKGDKQKYLVNAGVVPVQSQSSWFGTSPMKSANRGMVSPSPMSQNIAQLQDKDIDGTEATDDSHMTDGSGLQSSSMPAAAGYVNTPVGPAFSGLSNLSTDSQRPPPNSPFNNYPNNGTPFMSSSKMSTRFDGTFTGESKPSEDGPALSFSEFVARQKTNGGTPMTNNNQPNSFGNSSALVSQKLDFSGAVGANAASKNYGDVMAPINYNGSTKSSARFAGTGGTNSWDVPISNSNNNGFGSPSVKSTIVRESTPVASSSSSMKVGPVRNSTSPSPVESNDASNEVAVKAKGGFFSAFFGRGRNGKVGAVNTPNKLDPIQENASSRNLTPNLRTSTSAGSVKSSSKAGGTLFQENNTSSTKRQNSPATFQSPSSRTLNVGSSMKSMRNVPMSKEEAEMMELRAQLAQLQSQKSPGFGINQ